MLRFQDWLFGFRGFAGFLRDALITLAAIVSFALMGVLYAHVFLL